MAARKKLTLRKKPQHTRSQATVDAILEAATYILVRKGWPAFTTNHVAERAGVNIASLYQYFPNKEAIVAELQRRHGARVRTTVASSASMLEGRGELQEILRTVVQATVAEHRVAPALHRVFAEELPKAARRTAAEPPALQERMRALLAPHLAWHPEPDLALFVARTAVHAAVHEAAIERPELLAQSAFVDELVRLLDGYLTKSVQSTPGPPRS